MKRSCNSEVPILQTVVVRSRSRLGRMPEQLIERREVGLGEPWFKTVAEEVEELVIRGLDRLLWI